MTSASKSEERQEKEREKGIAMMIAGALRLFKANGATVLLGLAATGGGYGGFNLMHTHLAEQETHMASVEKKIAAHDIVLADIDKKLALLEQSAGTTARTAQDTNDSVKDLTKAVYLLEGMQTRGAAPSALRTR